MKEEALGTLRGSGQLEAIGLDNIFRLGDDVLGVLTSRIAQGQGQGQGQDAPSAPAPSRAEAQPAGS